MKLRQKLYNIIFEADTPAGKTFDVTLLGIIILSIIIVILESVESINQVYGSTFKIIEWFITIIFTLEYILRIWIVNRPQKYIFSFYGIIDFLAFLPAYLAIFISGAHTFIIIRALRLLRIFRIFKLNRYSQENFVIIEALIASRRKISVFLYTIFTLTILIGTLMYLIEGSENGFTSIPRSIYWTIVTLTTVGYGDIAPHTTIGQAIAAIVMILGYSIIAVPTGIVSAEISSQKIKMRNTQVCPDCLKEGHETNATFCKYCGTKLNE